MSDFVKALYQDNPHANKTPTVAEIAWWDDYRAKHGDAVTTNTFHQAVANVTGTPVWTGTVSSPAPSPAPTPAPAPAGGGETLTPAPVPAPAPTPAPAPAGGGESLTPAPAPGMTPAKPDDQWFPGVSNRTVTLGAGLLVAAVILFGGK